MGFDTVDIYVLRLSHWRGIQEVLEQNGVEVLITQVPGTGSIEERGKVLERAISNQYAGRSVHLIAHSMVRI
jgi:triacylglycerol lipase